MDKKEKKIADGLLALTIIYLLVFSSCADPLTGNSPVTLSQLTEAIVTADRLKSDTGVGTAIGQVSSATSVAFANTIIAAEAVRDNSARTQEELDTTYSNLIAAQKTFQAKIIVATGGNADTTALNAAIATAETNKNNTGVGTAIGMVSQPDIDTYVAAIFAAQTASNLAESQATVDAALATLAAATEAFNSAKIGTVKPGDAPTTVPASPTKPSDSVLSLHNSSGTYTNVMVNDWNPNWGQAGTLTDTTVAGKVVKLLNLVNYQGVDFDKNRLDISTKNTLHFSYYTTNGTSLAVYPISATSEYIIDTGVITKDSWTEVTLLINKAGFDLSTLRQLKFEGSGTYYLDNIYFYGNPEIPVITLKGESAITLEVAGTYTEQGATAQDNKDGDISASIVIAGDIVDTSTAGTYTVTYNVIDSDGNAAIEVIRTITVKKPLPNPTGAAPLTADLTNAVVIYSDKKASDASNVNYLALWSSNGAQREFEIVANEKVLEYEVTSRGSDAAGSATFGIEMNALDVSAKSNIHMDLYVQGDVDLLKVKFVSPNNGEAAGFAALLDDTGTNVSAKGEWISIDLPLANIPIAPGAAGTVAWNNLIQIVFITYGPASTVDEDTRFLLDNLYFY